MKPETARFKVESALLEELGERLVSSPDVALIELIKNSYDADATECHVEFSQDEVVVRDDGNGMRVQDFLNLWMVIGTRNKARNGLSTKYSRKVSGSKGVGRFAARFLGSYMTLTTVAEDNGARQELSATFDWDAAQEFGDLQDVTVPYSVRNVSHEVPTGTTLKITRLRKVINATAPTGIAAPEVTTYRWDNADRLLGHTTNIGGQDHSTNYSYDAAGRLSARKVQAGNTPDLITQAYGYDSLDRLSQIKYLKATGTAGEQLIEQIDYEYDANGRRTAKTTLNANGTGQGETPMTTVLDAANRMTAITLNLGGTSKTWNLTYDANGNLVQKQNAADTSEQTLYVWDASNRLMRIEQGGAGGGNLLTASYGYDAFGRRIQNTVSQGGQTSTVQYFYEGAQALGEIRDGKLSYRLLTGLNLDESIARIAVNVSGQKDASISRIYITDALNSVIAQLVDDGSANLQNSYAYSPYGESSTVGPDGTGNPVQYTSRENDGATGLSFYRARYYDPIGKVFISEDPIGLAAGLNMRGYVNGNPVSMIDPMGLMGGSGSGAAQRPAEHNYEWKVFRCIGDCSAQAFKDLRCNPAPGVYPKQLTVTGDENIVSLAGLELGPITTVVSPTTPTTWNLTMPGHVLHPGWVRRDVVVEGGATWIVNTGGGTGWNPLNMNVILAPFVWGGQNPLRSGADGCTCSR